MKSTKIVEGAEADRAREIVEMYLHAAIDQGAQAAGCTPGSFVTMAMAVWSADLAEVDAAATADMLRALAKLVDPCSGGGDRKAAESDRVRALVRLHQMIDLLVCDAEGSA